MKKNARDSPSLYSDSDQSSNTEAVAKRKSQLSYITMRGHALIMSGRSARLLAYHLTTTRSASRIVVATSLPAIQ